MITVLSLFPEEISSSMNLSEKLASIFNTAIIGFLVVIVVMAIIWAILEIFGRIFGKEKAEDAPEAKEAPAVPAAEEESGAAEEELVAVITAAVAAASEKPASSFRVVSFRRAGRS